MTKTSALLGLILTLGTLSPAQDTGLSCLLSWVDPNPTGTVKYATLTRVDGSKVTFLANVTNATQFTTQILPGANSFRLRLIGTNEVPSPEVSVDLFAPLAPVGFSAQVILKFGSP